jgi:tetratricopeptide (TPR) repeat protein
LDGLSVEITDAGRPVDKAAVSPDGTFEFRGIPEGNYQVRIVTMYGEIVRREFVYIGEHTGTLMLKLLGMKQQQPVSGTVSMRELLNPVPEKARKELLRADGAYSKGNVEESIRHLQKAIEIHPNYLEAHNNLGVRYMRMSDFRRAADEFRRGTEIEPANVLSQANLALALAALRQYPEAEQAARRALAADQSFMSASYALGLSLAGQNNCTLEGVESMIKASGKYPKARLGTAHLLACKGDDKAAASQLRTYLTLPDVERREIEKWLTNLERSAKR